MRAHRYTVTWNGLCVHIFINQCPCRLSFTPTCTVNVYLSSCQVVPIGRDTETRDRLPVRAWVWVYECAWVCTFEWVWVSVHVCMCVRTCTTLYVHCRCVTSSHRLYRGKRNGKFYTRTCIVHGTIRPDEKQHAHTAHKPFPPSYTLTIVLQYQICFGPSQYRLQPTMALHIQPDIVHTM